MFQSLSNELIIAVMEFQIRMSWMLNGDWMGCRVERLDNELQKATIPGTNPPGSLGDVL